jgi:hypothetical protein
MLLDFKIMYSHVQFNSSLLNLRNCTPKLKTNIWVNAVILLHDNTCPRAAQLNDMQWERSNTVHTVWTCDFYMFGLFLKALKFCTLISDNDEQETVR